MLSLPSSPIMGSATFPKLAKGYAVRPVPSLDVRSHHLYLTSVIAFASICIQH